MNCPTRPLCFAVFASLGLCLSAGAQSIQERDLTRLASDDIAIIQEARVSIIDVIDDRTMGIQDRSTASSQLIEPVRTLVESEDEIIIVNGLMIAGNIVTPDAIGLIEPSYESDKAGVRYASMKALRTTFRILGSQRTPSLQTPELERQISAAAEILQSDSDPFVAEGAARALLQAAKMTDNRLSATAEHAFSELAQGTSKRVAGIAAMPQDKQTGIVRIAMLSTFELSRLLQSGSNKPSQESVKQAAGLAGDSLAYVYTRFQAADRKIESIDEAESAVLAQLIGASENLVYYSQVEIGRQGEQTALRTLFEAGNDSAFNRGILTIIGGAGVLTRPPFSLSADRFIASGG